MIPMYAIPDSCFVCQFFYERKDRNAWPYVCSLDEMEVADNKDRIPGDCPLIEILSERGSNR